MKVGDLVKCVCAFPMWYKGVPGVAVVATKFSTKVLIKGIVIELCSSQLELI